MGQSHHKCVLFYVGVAKTIRGGKRQNPAPYSCHRKTKMNEKNNEVNWGTIQEASSIAAKLAVRKFGFKNYDLEELQNELICFILADTPRSRKFTRYTTGDATPEKLNKLVYSLNTDRSWLNGILHSVSERNFAEGVKVIRVDNSMAKQIVKTLFSGDTMETEAFHIIGDRLREQLSASQRAILTSVYSNPSISKKDVAIEHGIGWRYVYKVIEKAVAIAQRAWLPVFE